MPRLFDRVITFHVQGEIYNDNDATPESIINGYTWFPKDVNSEIHLIGRHKDKNGRINKMVKLPAVHEYHQSDSELFLQL